MKKAIAALLPPDLHDYQDYLNYRNNPKLTNPPTALASDIETRLTWQATSEFGVMLLRGRTMEASGSACIAWDWQKIDKTVKQISDRIESVDTQLKKISEDNLRRWLLGILYRYRLRGALGHSYLEDLARKSYWGKAPFGRSILSREVHPPMNRYRPKLMVTGSDRSHDFIFGNTSGNTQPWHIRWTHRVLNSPMSEAETVDLLKLLYQAAEATKLLLRLHTDGNKAYYAINPTAVNLVPNGVRLICSETGRQIVRPEQEAIFWNGAPSLEYSARTGAYRPEDFTKRQVYYQDRYRKGALRRVVASEHTGLLATEERETLERTFALNEHTDDPNVLTCTSTLEMGIDIGDLSSTMLCSIPPTTASYLQRIGRAGRATGTALIVSVIKHQPHDLFFYARPVEMLRGKVDAPGCWVDASAVLVRQYLAYCFDSAVKTGNLSELPRTGTQLIRDIENLKGHIPRMLQWIAQNETQLQESFLARFLDVIRDDTRTRFCSETITELLQQRIRKVVNEFDRQRREIDNARRRLQNQKSQIEEHEEDALREIEDELRVLKGRQNSLSRITTLELLTDHGLLPNYAFPESGVRFYGSVYNRHRVRENPVPPIEVVRPAATALRELAPHNHFYTHKRQFEIQQISIGSKEEPLTETWAICGQCGHMRLTSNINQEPACPQCGHDSGDDSQADIGQHRSFIDFSRSEAISVMEEYDSLSSDRADEREHTIYQRRRSFDLTVDEPTGAVGEETLPFGIEYRAAVVLREVNVGYFDEVGTVAFGPEGNAPERGFQVCTDCGVVATPGKFIEQVTHRRSCSARRRQEKTKAEGRSSNPFKAESVYLYREIRSEAIRILVPSWIDDDIPTLEACILLGLRLRFEGDPSHLTIFPQRLPDGAKNIQRDYLIILDRVPGATGYLKTLFQETDATGRAGEGIMTVMRRALDALETCRCGRLSEKESDRDTDGCYRCIRTYAQQYSATSISRERGIKLLKQLIAAGDRRVEHKALTEIPDNSLLGSVLERKFVCKLEEWVNEHNGIWEKTLVYGKAGFRFNLPNASRTWELELQPQLGLAQGVAIACQPDFLLRCADDESIKPVAIFTDGFEFHVEINRLADDMAKRRAILASGRYHIWNLTWNDLTATKLEEFLVVPQAIATKVEIFANAGINQGIPSGRLAVGNAWQQITGFIQCPQASGWRRLAEFTAAFPLEILAEKYAYAESALRISLNDWRNGQGFIVPASIDNGEWICYDKISGGTDVIALATIADCLTNRRDRVRVTARLDDSETERLATQTYRPRWRKFLSCLNLLQFCGAFSFFTTSEVEAGTAPDVLPDTSFVEASGEWAQVRSEVIPSLRFVVDELAALGVPVPQAAYEDEAVDENAVAELAWLEARIAVLGGDQALLVSAWQLNGWTVVSANEIQAKGTAFLIELIEIRRNS